MQMFPPIAPNGASGSKKQTELNRIASAARGTHRFVTDRRHRTILAAPGEQDARKTESSSDFSLAAGFFFVV
jgi:hypothetical protein